MLCPAACGASVSLTCKVGRASAGARLLRAPFARACVQPPRSAAAECRPRGAGVAGSGLV